MRNDKLTFGTIIFLSAIMLIPQMYDQNAFANGGAIRDNSGFSDNTLDPNDDGSTDCVNIGFNVDFFGTVFSCLFVNNNGNITFDEELSTYTPFDLTSTGQQIIAPFFADVDTRDAGSPVRYGHDVVNGNDAFGVNWIAVSCYYSDETTPKGFNDFQLVLIDRSDISPGDFDIEFNYNQILWETGTASDGSDECLGGDSARVGWSDGTGNDGTFFELAGSAVNGAFLDNGPADTALILNSLNSNIDGRYVFTVRGGQVSQEPQPEPTACEMYAGMARTGNEDPINGSLAIVNLDTGNLQEVGPAASALEDFINDKFEQQLRLGLSGIAFNSEGKLFGSIVGGNEPISGLVEIDPSTGELLLDFEDVNLNSLFVIHIGDLENKDFIKIVDLAFHPETDMLYGIARVDGVDLLVTIDTTTAEATVVGHLVLVDMEVEMFAGGLSFLSDGTMLVTGEFYDEGWTNTISTYLQNSYGPAEYILPEDWTTLDYFYDGLGVSCEDEIYGTTGGGEQDSIHLITLSDGEGLQADEELVAGEGTNPGDVDFLPASEPKVRTSNGGDNQWDTRPTFGISHEDRANQVVENGFRFNTNEFTLTDNHWTPFAEQEVEIGTTNSFSATVYADKKLKIQEFLFGIPNVGESHLAELGVEVWYDRDGQIEDVKVVQKSDVIDADTVSVSHEKVKCLSTDAEAKCDTTTVSMKFLEPLADKVMAIKAIDYALRDQRTFLNEGFNISGESLNPMASKLIPSNVRNEGLLQVTQVAKYSPYWSTEDGRMFEMNSFGSFKQINQKFERFEDTGNAFTRLHSGFGGIIQYEQNRATKIFDATKLISELPDSFGYHFERTDRMTDEMKQQMLLQQEIAREILDEMDKQNRHY